MGKRHVTRPHFMQPPQLGNGVLNRVTTFHADHGSDLTGGANPIHIVAVQCQFEGLGIARDHGFDNFNLFDRRLMCGTGFHRVGRHEDRPILSADAAQFQSRNIGMNFWLWLGNIERIERARSLGAHDPGQIVVAIEHVAPPVNRPRFCGNVDPGSFDWCRSRFALLPQPNSA